MVNGGYSEGEIELTEGTTLYVYVGGQGTASDITDYTEQSGGGYNGGGDAGAAHACPLHRKMPCAGGGVLSEGEALSGGRKRRRGGDHEP